MTLSAQNKVYLDELRDRIKVKHATYNEDDMLKLSSVYGEVLNFSGIKGGGKIDKSCSSCAMEAVKILHNYITYHEPVIPVHRATIVKEVKPVVNYGANNNFPNAIIKLAEGSVKPEADPYVYPAGSLPVVEFVDNNDDVTIIDLVGHGEGESVNGDFVVFKKPEVDSHSKVPDFKHTPEPPVKKTRRPRTVKQKSK